MSLLHLGAPLRLGGPAGAHFLAELVELIVRENAQNLAPQLAASHGIVRAAFGMRPGILID